MPLTGDEISQYQDRGFVGPLRAFGQDEIDASRIEIAGLLSGEESGHARHRDHRCMFEICTSDVILGCVAGLAIRYTTPFVKLLRNIKPILALVALFASLRPVLRAVRLQPAGALREG
jgi:hypothetical protein